MHCRIQVRYARGVDRLRVARSLLGLWNGTNRPQLCHVPASGRLYPADEGSLAEDLEFDAEHVAVVTLKHRRRNKDTDSVRLRFCESGHEPAADDAGECHVNFHHERVDHSEPGYTPADLVEILAGLVAAGPVSEAYCFGGDPFAVGDFREAARRAKRVDTGAGVFRSLWWLTFVPERRLAPTLAELDRLGIEHAVPRSIHDRGSIVSLSPKYPGNSPGFHETIRRIRQLSREEAIRSWVLDLETLPVFRLAGKALEIRPFPALDHAAPGSSAGSESSEANRRFSDLARSFAAGRTSEGPVALPGGFPQGRLDLSKPSLEAVAAYFLHLQTHLDEVGAPQLQLTLQAAGAYLGEIARLNAAEEFHWKEHEDWTRTHATLASRLRGASGKCAALVSEVAGVARPIDRVMELFPGVAAI
ncbi:MAG: hypothetical protein AAB074_07095 [Planctomycetota bacterium]